MGEDYDMAEEFHDNVESIDNGKIEHLSGEEYHQHHDTSEVHVDSTSIFPGPREAKHLNEYLAHFWGEAPIQSYEDKIYRIQQFNETEIPEFVGWIDRHYPSDGEDNEYSHGIYGQLESSPGPGWTVGLPAQGFAGSSTNQIQSNVRVKKENPGFALPEFLQPTPFKPPPISEFVSQQATEARARAAQYAYYNALRDQRQEAAMAMGTEMRLIAGAASSLEKNRERLIADYGARVPEQEQNETRTKKGKKRAGRMEI